MSNTTRKENQNDKAGNYVQCIRTTVDEEIELKWAQIDNKIKHP